MNLKNFSTNNKLDKLEINIEKMFSENKNDFILSREKELRKTRKLIVLTGLFVVVSIVLMLLN